MHIDKRVIGAGLIALTARATAQTTPGCARTTAEGSGPARRTIYVVSDRMVTDSTGSPVLVRGPGDVFGITSYRCADCLMKREPGKRPQNTFFAEPVVESVLRATPVQAGDVIEAVNDRPITTSAGSEQFSYPPLGATTLTVRRGRDRVILRFDVAPCTPRKDTTIQFTLEKTWAAPDSLPPVRTLPLKRIEGTIQKRRMPDSLAQPIYVIDGVRIDPLPSSPPATGYGFAFSCGSGCTRVTKPDGTSFYRFSATPKVTAIRDDSPASKAGLRAGDVVTKIDGISILDDEASIRLSEAEHKVPLRITVIRDGKEVEYVLQPSK